MGLQMRGRREIVETLWQLDQLAGVISTAISVVVVIGHVVYVVMSGILGGRDRERVAGGRMLSAAASLRRLYRAL